MFTHPRALLAALLLILVSTSGCYTVQYAIPSEHPPSSYDVVNSFEVEKRASWLIFGLVPLNEAEVEEIVAREVRRAEGDAATNIVVTAEYDAVDVIVAAIVGGLFNTRSYTVTGDVVRFPENLGANQPPADPSDSVILGDITYQRVSRR